MVVFAMAPSLRLPGLRAWRRRRKVAALRQVAGGQQVRQERAGSSLSLSADDLPTPDCQPPPAARMDQTVFASLSLLRFCSCRACLPSA